MSLLMNVTRVPRGTVRLVGHPALFRIRNVVAGFGMVEQVMFGDGAVSELLPHETPNATGAARTAPSISIFSAFRKRIVRFGTHHSSFVPRELPHGLDSLDRSVMRCGHRMP